MRVRLGEGYRARFASTKTATTTKRTFLRFDVRSFLALFSRLLSFFFLGSVFFLSRLYFSRLFCRRGSVVSARKAFQVKTRENLSVQLFDVLFRGHKLLECDHIRFIVTLRFGFKLGLRLGLGLGLPESGAIFCARKKEKKKKKRQEPRRQGKKRRHFSARAETR